MGSAASTLDPSSMSIHPPHTLTRDHSSQGSRSTGRSSIGLSAPLSKIDLSRSTGSNSTFAGTGAVKGKGKAKGGAEDDEEKEEGEISDDEEDPQEFLAASSYPLPARQNPLPPRGQPIDRTRDAPRQAGRKRGSSKERTWEEYNRERDRERASFDDDGRGSRGRRESPSYHPYTSATQSVPVGYRPGYRPLPPDSMTLPYGPRPSTPIRPPSGPIRTPSSGPIRPPFDLARPPYPPNAPTAPRGLQPPPPVAFRPNPNSVPTPRPAPPPQPSQTVPGPPVRPDPGQLAAAPANMSPDEAQQYMGILRNLLQDGVTPDQLVKHGATPTYVRAVCEEIVEGQRKRKSLWMGTNPGPSSSTGRPPMFPRPTPMPGGAAAAPQVVAGLSSLPLASVLPPPTGSQPGDASHPIVLLDSSPSTTRAPSIRSPSPQVRVVRSIDMDRGASLSSEGSAEQALIDSSPSPPRRLVASSHWAPPVRPSAAPPSRAIKIESYKPPSPSPVPDPNLQGNHSVQSAMSDGVAVRPGALSVNGKAPPSGPRSAGLYRRNSNLAQATSSAPAAQSAVTIDRPEGSASASKRPRRASPERSVSRTTSIGSLSDPRASSSLIEPPPAHFGTIKHPLPEKPFLDLSVEDAPIPEHLNQGSVVPQYISHPSLAQPGPLHSLPDQSSVAAELASKNAVLEARRRALESMRAARKKKAANVDGSASPMDMDLDVDTPTTAAITLTETLTIEVESNVNDALTAAVSLEAAMAAERTIEDEVADLEQEVMGFQTALAQEAQPEPSQEQTTVDATAVETLNPFEPSKEDIGDQDATMDVDEPEEGELPPEDPLPPTLPIIAAAASSRRSRNRPGAEDLDSRPTTAPSRARRKPFGAPQRASKLVLQLEDSDSDSEPDTPNDQAQRRAEILRRLAEEKLYSPMPFGPGPAFEQSKQEQDAIAAHEAEIQALKAKIAARLKAKEAARLAREGAGSDGESSRGDSAVPEDIPTPSGGIVRAESPLKQEVTLVARAELEGMEMEIKQENVEVQAVVQSTIMEVDIGPTNDSPASPPPAAAAIAADGESNPQEGLAQAWPPQDLPFSPLDDRSPLAVPQAPPIVAFAPYSGLLSRYPQLSKGATTVSDSNFGIKQIPLVLEETPTGPIAPRRDVLRGIMLTRITLQNPNASLCSAEVGGGTCADPSCQAIHFDMDLEPTAEDLVEYVVESVPSLDRAMVKRAVDLVLKMNASTASTAPKTTPKKGKGKGRAKAVDPAPSAGDKLEFLTMTLSKISHALGLVSR